MENEEKIVKCLNCGTEFIGNFCPHCGQKSKVKRLKFKEIVADFVNSLIGGDNKFVNTLSGLCCRPGHMVREYLQGHRNRYYNPLQMLIWIVSVYAVLSFLLGSDPFQFNGLPKDKVVPLTGTPWEVFVAVVKNTSNYISYNKLYYSIFLGISLIVPYRIAYRKLKVGRPDGAELPLNYTEQFYVLMYESCMEMMLATLLLPFSLIKGTDDILKDVNGYANFLFTLIIYKQLYCIGWWKCIRHTLAAVVIWIVCVFVVVVVVALLLVAIFILIYGEDEFNV